MEFLSFFSRFLGYSGCYSEQLRLLPGTFEEENKLSMQEFGGL